MKDIEVVASAMFPFLLTERERLVASELSKRIVSLHAQLEAARKVVEAMREVADWREDAHEYDDDIGYPRRDFVDAEEWECLERYATEALAAYDAACGKGE